MPTCFILDYFQSPGADWKRLGGILGAQSKSSGRVGPPESKTWRHQRHENAILVQLAPFCVYIRSPGASWNVYNRRPEGARALQNGQAGAIGGTKRPLESPHSTPGPPKMPPGEPQDSLESIRSLEFPPGGPPGPPGMHLIPPARKGILAICKYRYRQ